MVKGVSHPSPSTSRRPGRSLPALFVMLIGVCLCLFSAWALWPARSGGADREGQMAAPLGVATPSPTPFQPRPLSPGFGVSLQFVTPAATLALASPIPSPLPSATPTSEAPLEATPTPEAIADLPTPTPFVPVTPTPGLIWVSIVPDTPTPAFLPPPLTSAGAGERWIDVDLSEQRLYAYEGDTLVNSFVVSTGTWQYPTVKGTFKIYVKLRYADMSGPDYYLPSVPYVMYFYKGYGLHGTYWHNNFGVPMSHGCVNLRVSDAAWLFNWASVGTVVRVHD